MIIEGKIYYVISTKVSIVYKFIDQLNKYTSSSRMSMLHATYSSLMSRVAYIMVDEYGQAKY